MTDGGAGVCAAVSGVVVCVAAADGSVVFEMEKAGREVSGGQAKGGAAVCVGIAGVGPAHVGTADIAAVRRGVVITADLAGGDELSGRIRGASISAESVGIAAPSPAGTVPQHGNNHMKGV